MESVPWMETRMAPERKQIRSGLSPPPYRNLISTAIIKTHTHTQTQMSQLKNTCNSSHLVPEVAENVTSSQRLRFPGLQHPSHKEEIVTEKKYIYKQVGSLFLQRRK